jgi:hypothetical protein
MGHSFETPPCYGEHSCRVCQDVARQHLASVGEHIISKGTFQDVCKVALVWRRDHGWAPAGVLPVVDKAVTVTVTKSTEEAMELLETSKASLVAYGRKEAIRLAKENGEVTSRDVRQAMEGAGLLKKDSKEHWLGAVFRGKPFKWTGRYFVYSDPIRNIHERTIKIWTISE